MSKDSAAALDRDISRPIFSQINYLSFAYFGSLIVALIVLGSSPLFYGLFAVCAVFFILPYNFLSGMSAAVILTMFFERYFTLQPLIINRQIYKFYLLDIILCLSLLSWILALSTRKNKAKEKLKRIGWPEYALMLWLALVAVWMIRSLTDINADFAVAFSSFKNYFFYPLLYLLFAFALTTRKKFHDFIHLFIYGAAGLLIFLAIGVINGVGLWTEFTPLSTAGVRYLAGTHAFYLCLAFVIAAALLAYGRFRQSGLAISIMSLWSLGIVFSLMRHLYLAVACGLIALFILADSKRKKILWHYGRVSGAILASLAIIIILFTSLTYYSFNPNSAGSGLSSLTARIGTISNLSEDSSASWRARLWSIAKDEWQKNPIIGSGFGHSVLIETADYQSFEELRNIHNSPLAITVQMGLVGALAFAAFVLAVLYRGYKNIRKKSDPYVIGTVAAAIVFLSACFFQPYLETNMMGIWLWIFLGLIRASDFIEN